MSTNAELAAALYPEPAAPPKAPPNATAAQAVYPNLESGAPPSTARAGKGDDRPTADVIYRGAVPLPPGVPGFDGIEEGASPEEVAAAMYDDHPDTIEPVKWDEPAAPAGDLREVIADAVSKSDAFDPSADLPKLAGAFAAVGMGQTFAREVMTHASRAATDGYEPMDPDAVMQDLRKSWGKNTDKNIGRAQAAIRAANEKDPRIVPFLNRTGLGNDPAFIRKVHASLQRRRAGA